MSSPLSFLIEDGVRAHVDPLDSCIARLHFTRDGVDIPPPESVRVRYHDGGVCDLKPFRDDFLLVWLHDYDLVEGSTMYQLQRCRQIVQYIT